MNRLRFEKFEMKYGYFFPLEFKAFMNKYGGDTQFGSCRFEYPDNIINNIIRIPYEMDFHLIPFGDIGNGDYYCFYRYGAEQNEYFIGIWLHETRNFVILASNFKSFLYKCLLDDYLSTVVINEELSEDERLLSSAESLERCDLLSREYGYDLDKVKKMKDEFDYHRLMVEYDNSALQSLCFIGKYLLKNGDKSGFDFLEQGRKVYSFYSAPYYLAGKALININKEPKDIFLKALKTSLVLTGYSYWEEDYLEIPEDLHREITLYVDKYLKDSRDYLEERLYNGQDPYSYELRLEMAKLYASQEKYNDSMIEYSNALFCCDDKNIAKEILKQALQAAKDGGVNYLTGIIEHDIRILK